MQVALALSFFHTKEYKSFQTNWEMTNNLPQVAQLVDATATRRPSDSKTQVLGRADAPRENSGLGAARARAPRPDLG